MTPDRRSTPATDRVAITRLRGSLERPAWTEGRPARLAAALADLCRAPGGARDRQLLHGAELLVVDEAEGWAFVEAQADGYCGWVEAAALTHFRPALTHRVAVPATHVYREPDIKRGELMALSLGARLAGRPEGRFLALAGGGFVPLQHVGEGPAADPVEVALSLLGTPYLWGGNSRSGIDCSGLVQAALLACDIPCPGDSDQQWAAVGTEVPLDALSRGDLLFWRGHVAMAVSPDAMVHANGHAMAVTVEPVAAAMTRIAAAGEGAFLGVRRPR